MTEYALNGAPIRGPGAPGRFYPAATGFTFCETLRTSGYFPGVPILRRLPGGSWEPLTITPERSTA